MNAAWWAQVRAHREAQTPMTDPLLWRLSKDGKIAEARSRAVAGRGVELRFLWQGELRSSQVYDDTAALHAAAEAKRAELLEVGWRDAPDLQWGR